EAIQLGADLTKLAAYDLVVIRKLIGPSRPEGLWNPETEVSPAEQRHARFIRASELVDDSRDDQALRFEDLRRRDAVGGSALVVHAPARRVPTVRLRERHGSDSNDHDQNRLDTTRHCSPDRRILSKPSGTICDRVASYAAKRAALIATLVVSAGA